MEQTEIKFVISVTAGTNMASKFRIFLFRQALPGEYIACLTILKQVYIIAILVFLIIHQVGTQMLAAVDSIYALHVITTIMVICQADTGVIIAIIMQQVHIMLEELYFGICFHAIFMSPKQQVVQ